MDSSDYGRRDRVTVAGRARRAYATTQSNVIIANCWTQLGSRSSFDLSVI